MPFKWYFSSSLSTRGKHSVLNQNTYVMLDVQSGYSMFPEIPNMKCMPVKS